MSYRDMKNLPGPGDPETWGPCTGHPMDPRTVMVEETPEYEDMAQFLFEEKVLDLRGWLAESVSEAPDEKLTELAELVIGYGKSSTPAEPDYLLKIGKLVCNLISEYCSPTHDEIVRELERD